jgi:16S rRNA (uracil1498-N3)-methyltransferase
VTLHRFFVAPDEMVGDRFALPAPIERQVKRVLRLRDGDRLVLFCGDGREALCLLRAGECVVEERRSVTTEPRHRLTIVQALLKGDALEEVVRQATEIGVARFRLVITDRCVVRDISSRKLERLRSIVREAAEQAERGIVPAVESPVGLPDAFGSDAVLLYERNAEMRLSTVELPGAIIIGPEGGFTESEATAATAAGVRLAGLGPRILRSQSVAAAAASVVLSRTGDFA